MGGIKAGNVHAGIKQLLNKGAIAVVMSDGADDFGLFFLHKFSSGCRRRFLADYREGSSS
jgi:hypothetical protein